MPISNTAADVVPGDNVTGTEHHAVLSGLVDRIPDAMGESGSHLNII
jgi:hypothetical protein